MAKRKPAKASTAPVPPTCSCLVLCDDVIVSHGRDKHDLRGIIGAIGVPQLPAIAGNLVVYVRLSNVHSQQRVTVSFAPADDHEADPLWEFDAQLVSRNDPLSVHTLVTRVPPFRVERGGRYVLTVKHDGIPIAQTPVQIMAPGPSPEGQS